MKKPVLTLLDPFSSDIRSDDPKTIREYGEKFTEILEKIDNSKYNGRNIFMFYLSISGEKPKPA